MKIQVMNVLFLTSSDFNHPDIKHVSDLTKEYLIDDSLCMKADLIIVQYKGESRIIKNRYDIIDYTTPQNIPSRLDENDNLSLPIVESIKYTDYGYISLNDSIPCLHESCSSCNGTGKKINGQGLCIHMISCSCPKCSPR